jgi:hypothetical protein
MIRMTLAVACLLVLVTSWFLRAPSRRGVRTDWRGILLDAWTAVGLACNAWAFLLSLARVGP